MAYDDEEESNLFYRKSVLHALKLKRVVNVCFFVFFFQEWRTQGGQQRGREGTESRLKKRFFFLYIVLKWTLVLLFVDNFLFFLKSSTFLRAIVNMTESKANDNETFNSAAKSNMYIKRELI